MYRTSLQDLTRMVEVGHYFSTLPSEQYIEKPSSWSRYFGKYSAQLPLRPLPNSTAWEKTLNVPRFEPASYNSSKWFAR